MKQLGLFEIILVAVLAAILFPVFRRSLRAAVQSFWAAIRNAPQLPQPATAKFTGAVESLTVVLITALLSLICIMVIVGNNSP